MRPAGVISNVATDNKESLDRLVEEANKYIDMMYEKDGKVSDSFFQALSVRLSRNNLVNADDAIKGGPFGAIIVQYEGGIENGTGRGKPKIVGVGSNHVVPQSDPTAHAEMVAYRDAAERLGRTDFSDCALFTSCACCPMCLGIANGSGIQYINYVNTPEQADQIAGFADWLQYTHFNLPREEQMSPLSKLESAERERLTTLLGAHGAVIIGRDGSVIGVGDDATDKDPTMVASIAAIRNATKASGNFCLPEGSTLVCRDMPHPSGLIAADWARMLRKRDEQAPNDPGMDEKTIDPKRIIYVNPNYEQVMVSDGKGGRRIAQDSAVTYLQPALPDDERAVRTERHQSALDAQKHPNNAVHTAARQVFENWHKLTGMGGAKKY